MSEKKGQGIGTATLKVVQDMAFNQLDAHRLELDVFEHNEAALRVYTSAGFTTEGVLAIRTSRLKGFGSVTAGAI